MDVIDIDQPSCKIWFPVVSLSHFIVKLYIKTKPKRLIWITSHKCINNANKIKNIIFEFHTGLIQKMAN